VEPLDLTKRPPRSARATLDGLVMLPRTIDKMRALLPGGNIGEYHIDGFSGRMMKLIGIEPDALAAEVARAATEDEVAAWVRAHATAGSYDEANRVLLNRSFEDIEPGRRSEFAAKYPRHAEVASRKICDIIDADDAALFGHTTT
jgi:Domain of unknown function (DUF5069)